MSTLSKLADTLVGSEIVKLGNAISERIRQGEKIYNFTIGDFDPKIFPIPAQLEHEIIAAYQQKYTNYPPADGVLELRNAISKFLEKYASLTYSNSEILVASGGRPLIYTLFKTIVDEGDKVIYAVPSWNNNHYANLTNATHCLINTTPENNFMPTPADIEPHISGATLLCLCTPQNPTGTTLSKSHFSEICKMIVDENNRRQANEKKLYLMFDQMYWTLTHGSTQHANPIQVSSEMRPYTIFIDGISKSFAATGVRVGWAFGPAFIIAKMKALLSHVGAWAPMAEQKAVAQFLQNYDAIDAYFLQFKEALAIRLNAFYNGFIALKNKGYKVNAIAPQAAIYLTIEVNLVGATTSNGQVLANQADVTNYILSEVKVAIVPFYCFGAPATSAWYRMSIGTSKIEEVDAVLSSFENAMATLTW